MSSRSSRQPENLRNETSRSTRSAEASSRLISELTVWSPRAVDEQVGRGERDRWALRGGGLADAVEGRVDEGEELAGRWREGVVVEDGRVVDGGHEVVDQAVDDLELARGAVVAGEAAEQRLDEVVDEAGEDARGLGGVEVARLRRASLRRGSLRAPPRGGG